MRTALFLVAVVVGVMISTDAANILAPIWYLGNSHFAVYERLFKELAARGHNVTVVSHFPQKTPVANYNDISLAGSEPLYLNNITIMELLRVNMLGFRDFWKYMTDVCLRMYHHPEMQKLVRSTDHYDLVIVELFYTDCTVAFAHKFRAPLVGIISSMALPWSHDRVGNPEHPAYSQTYLTEATLPFNFWQRVWHTIQHVAMRSGNWYFSDLVVDCIVQKIFGEDVPTTTDLVRNTSLLLVNSHWSVHQLLPTAPAFIEVGGLHIQEPRDLPQELKKFLDDSVNGAIYFSMGSMIQVESFHREKLQAVVDVFSRLPQRVVWKVNATGLPPLPQNVKAATWLPQNDVLNHPKLLVFITHGGLLGKLEAIQAGVPMLVIPMFGDQFANAAKAVARGIAVKLLYEDLTFETLHDALEILVKDNRYRDRVRQLSELFRDRPRPPLEEAVYWVEYVLRHRGAPHLRSAALDLAWYQYLLLDVAAFCVAAVSLVLLLCYLLLRRALASLWARLQPREKIKVN